MAELRLEKAIMEMSWLASDEVSPEKLKTREDQDILDMEQDSVDVDNHEIGVNTEVDLEARLVIEELGLKKLKPRESLSNKIGFEVIIMDTGLAIEPGMDTGLAVETGLMTDTGNSNEINYDIGMDNHEIGVNINVELEARLVLEEVGPKKLKPGRA